jgi:hypothetical protein
VLIGLVACVTLWLVFPGKTLTHIGHGVLGLPGPGSAVSVIYGPFIVLASLLAAKLLRVRWAATIAGATFGVAHGAFTPLALGAVKTVGTVGPWPLRVAAVLAAVSVLQLVLAKPRPGSTLRRFCSAAAASHLALMVFYWAIIYPVARGKTVTPLGALVLLGAGVPVTCLVAALVSALPERHGAGEDRT